MSIPTTDRAAIRAILAHLITRGYRITGATDATRADFPHGATPAAMARYVCGYADDCNVYVRDRAGARFRLYFVLGNQPEEVLADYAAPTDALLDRLTNDLDALLDTWD